MRDILSIHRAGGEKRDIPVGPFLSIGRDEGCDLVLADGGVSKKHARIERKGERLFLVDLGSTNGTWVGASCVSAPVELRPGLAFRIGPFTLELLPAAPDDDEAALAQQAAFLKGAHEAVIERLDLRRLDLDALDDEALRRRTLAAIHEHFLALEAEGRLPPGTARKRLEAELANEMLGLGPLEELLADEGVTEVMVNGPRQIFVEREGRLALTEKRFSSEQAVLSVIERIVSPLGRRVDESSPMVDARLADGSRVHAVIPPLSLCGPCLTIRKFSKEWLGIEDLVRFGALSEAMARFLELAVRCRKNIVISGGTGSGKTTLLNVLTGFATDQERIITVEDAAELQIRKPHWVRLEARPPNLEGKGAVSIRDLVRGCLRMRPDRIVIGECRGGEALDMLQAMNTGHDGSLTTLHANTPRDALARLETLCLMAGMDLPVRVIRQQIVSAVDLVIQQARFADGSRRVTSVAEVVGLEGEVITLQEIYAFRREGVDAEGRTLGRHVSNGFVPRFCERLREEGVAVDLSLFERG